MSMDEERMLILQMVAEKKISATEAAELLKALDGVNASSGPGPRRDDFIRDVERTAREAAHTIERNARQMAHDAAVAARREGQVGSLMERLFEKFSFDFGDESKVSFEETSEGAFTAEEPRLNLRTGNGKLHLFGWDEPGYKLVLQYKVRGARDEADAKEQVRERVRVEANGEGITLDGQDGGFRDKGIGISVELWLPRTHRYLLEGRTGNGSLRLEGLSLTDGQLTSGNGSIRIEGVSASHLKTTTGNGSINVEADLTEFSGQTGNGSLKVRPTGERAQQISVSTGNGSARIDLSGLPQTAGYHLEATTGMGSINLHVNDLVLEQNIRTIGHKHMVGRSRNYEDAANRVEIKATTGMGSITIE